MNIWQYCMMCFRLMTMLVLLVMKLLYCSSSTKQQKYRMQQYSLCARVVHVSGTS